MSVTPCKPPVALALAEAPQGTCAGRPQAPGSSRPSQRWGLLARPPSTTPQPPLPALLSPRHLWRLPVGACLSPGWAATSLALSCARTPQECSLRPGQLRWLELRSPHHRWRPRWRPRRLAHLLLAPALPCVAVTPLLQGETSRCPLPVTGRVTRAWLRPRAERIAFGASGWDPLGYWIIFHSASVVARLGNGKPRCLTVMEEGRRDTRIPEGSGKAAGAWPVPQPPGGMCRGRPALQRPWLARCVLEAQDGTTAGFWDS